MPRKQARKLTEEEIKVVKAASAMGLPVEHIATLLSMSKTSFEKMVAKDKALQDGIASARVQAGYTMRQRLYEKAMKGDFQAMKFWLQTREGFRVTDRIEHTGADGRPIQTRAKNETTDPSRDEILAEMRLLSSRLQEAYGAD